MQIVAFETDGVKIQPADSEVSPGWSCIWRASIGNTTLSRTSLKCHHHSSVERNDHLGDDGESKDRDNHYGKNHVGKEDSKRDESAELKILNLSALGKRQSLDAKRV